MAKKRIPPEKIKELSIIDVARRFGIDAVRKGRTYKALCPAHSDTSIGSMAFSTKRESWYCFACGNGGSAIDLIAFHLDVDYVEAIRLIAEEYGIEARELTAEEKVRAKGQMKPEEYEYLGLKGTFGEHEDLNGERVVFRIKDDPELHDSILRGKLVEKCLQVYAAADRILDSAEVQGLLGLPLDDLPLMLDTARENTFLHILEIAERGFIDKTKNPLPSVKDYKQILAERRQMARDEFEVVLASQVS